MNTLVIFALCLFATAVAQEEEQFGGKWKKYMQENFCQGDDDQKEAVLNCATMIPEEMQEFMLEKTGAEDMSGALQAFCDDKELESEACKEFHEKGVQINEEDVEKVKNCMAES